MPAPGLEYEQIVSPWAAVPAAVNVACPPQVSCTLAAPGPRVGRERCMFNPMPLTFVLTPSEP